MRTIALSVALLTVVVVASAAPVPKAIKATADYYPSVVGTKWVYAYEDGTNEHSREVTAATTTDGVTEFTVLWQQGRSQQVWELKKDATGVYRTKQDGEAYTPPHKLLAPKMSAGDEWVSEYTHSGDTYKYSRSVGKAELVKTPAGEFTAIPIVSRDLSNDENESTLWYATGVGMVAIQHKAGQRIVLKEFILGGKK
ncbi:MAG: hypothetical protein MUF18_06175 [Fimbriiglobus sp.]|jgi:hypothetical protein|nr:hypothetical protein [Fimbriiglobus sp.]